jgi:hypothetical protein
MTEPVHTIADIHRERVFEEQLVGFLVTEQGYVERECAAHYDPEAALPDQLPLSYELRIVNRDGTRTGHWTLSEMGTDRIATTCLGSPLRRIALCSPILTFSLK